MPDADRINLQLPTSNFQCVSMDAGKHDWALGVGRWELTSAKTRLACLVLLAIVVTGARAESHRLDEYLQAVRVDLDLTRVEVRLALTPGVDVANTIVGDIDTDRDGVLSSNERAAYVSRVIDALHVDVDDRAVRLHSTDSRFPAPADLRGGEGTIAIRAAAEIPSLAPGAHRVHIRNAHHSEIGAYLANALVPETARIEIATQRRSADQRDLTIDYVVRAAE